MNMGKLFDALMERGFEPDENGWPDEWFNLRLGKQGSLDMPSGIVRVQVGSHELNIRALTGNGAEYWDARFTNGTPNSVIINAIDGAIAFVTYARYTTEG